MNIAMVEDEIGSLARNIAASELGSAVVDRVIVDNVLDSQDEPALKITIVLKNAKTLASHGVDVVARLRAGLRERDETRLPLIYWATTKELADSAGAEP